MKNFLLFLFASLIFATQSHAQFTKQDSTVVKGFYSEALSAAQAYNDLYYLCKKIGHRIAGSEAADKAILWGDSVLKSIPADNVFLMPVKVPKWKRGKKEYAAVYVGKKKTEVPLRALGGSGVTNGMLKAEVVEVKDFEDLKAKADQACPLVSTSTNSS
jgi:hypothetical protein